MVDASTSMSRRRDTTINGINEYIGTLKKDMPAETRVTVTFFTDLSHRRITETTFNHAVDVPIGELAELTRADYDPNGGTPLFDAIADTIKLIDDALGDSESPVFFAIVSDGEEMNSKRHNKETVAKLREEREARGWAFSFIGANMDAYGEGHKIGIADDDIVSAVDSTFGDVFAYAAASTSSLYGTAKNATTRASYSGLRASGSAPTFADKLKKAKLEK